MINRQNYLDVRDYLTHCARARQLAEKTVTRYRSSLRALLEWADAAPLPDVRRVDPTFPTYLLTARFDGRDKPLSPASIEKNLEAARSFYTFARLEWPLRYRHISASWIELLQPPRTARMESRLQVHEYWTLETVRQVATVAVETLRQARGQMAVCMLFLGGMRADALATLPIHCVDVAARRIEQLPEHGVRTKNRTAALTYLLEIPDLLAVVERWDARVRAELPASALWYATLTSDGMKVTATEQAYVGRPQVVEDDVRLICQLAGVPYLSPHKLRHGHAVHGIKQARNMQELKAVSQNLMHKSVMITDGVYGNLVADDVRNTIARLGHADERGQTSDGLESKIDELLRLLR